jgi:translocation protein SEC63
VLLDAKNVVKAIGCQCEGDLSKRAKKAADKPWERTKKLLKVVVLLVLWSLFLFLVYKVRNIEHEFAEYDPYKILQLDVVCFSLFFNQKLV